MAYIHENMNTLIASKCDVLVAGGGIAGVSAALAAARQGADVILIEKQFMLGGLATAGLVTIYLPLCDGMGHQVSFGLAEELLLLSIKYGYECLYPSAWLENGSLEEKTKQRFQVRYNAQLFAVAMEQLLLSAGVKILYGTSVVSAKTENDSITHIVIENKSGRSAIEVNSVVDTTGDADICHLSGEKTLLFSQKNILASWYYFTNGSTCNLKSLGCCDIPEKEKSEANKVTLLSNERFGGIDGEELSRMITLSHASLLNDVLKNKAENSEYMPMTMATIPQVRMTRRLDGIYTVNDTPSSFDDSIGVIGNWKKPGPAYEIPFSSLYGGVIKNLITAGRCISADDAMWDLTRVIPSCAVTGEAAGTAAAMTNNFAETDVAELQKRLQKAGVKLKYNI